MAVFTVNILGPASELATEAQVAAAPDDAAMREFVGKLGLASVALITEDRMLVAATLAAAGWAMPAIPVDLRKPELFRCGPLDNGSMEDLPSR